MNDNREKNKGSVLPWVLGAGALGGIGLALASRGKVKTGSVTKVAKSVNVPKTVPPVVVKPQTQPIKPQANIQEELAQIRRDAVGLESQPANVRMRQEAPKPQPRIKDELDRLRDSEPLKSKTKPTDIKDKLEKIRGEQPKVEEVKSKYRLTNKESSSKGKTEQSGVSGYGGLTKKQRASKLEKRRRDLAEGLYDSDPDFDVTKKKDPELFRSANSWKEDSTTGKLKRNAPLKRMEVNSSTTLYGGSDSKRIAKNKIIKDRNDKSLKRAKQIAKAENREYNYLDNYMADYKQIFLLCDI